MYIYIHAYTHTCTHSTQFASRVHGRCSSMHIHIYRHKYTHTHTYMYVCINIYTHTSTQFASRVRGRCSSIKPPRGGPKSSPNDHDPLYTLATCMYVYICVIYIYQFIKFDTIPTHMPHQQIAISLPEKWIRP